MHCNKLRAAQTRSIPIPPIGTSAIGAAANRCSIIARLVGRRVARHGLKQRRPLDHTQIPKLLDKLLKFLIFHGAPTESSAVITLTLHQYPKNRQAPLRFISL